MTILRYYGDPPPGLPEEALPGRLVVLEGVDGVGRSTQIALLSEWLEFRGFAVMNSGLTRSILASRGIERAKRGNTLDTLTLNLLYATDFWDRLERQIVPALRAGAIALVDRYIYSLMARAVVRGISPQWMTNLYGFAPIPDKVIYLDIDLQHLTPRVLSSTGFDYWESGQDFLRNPDMFDNFSHYQDALLTEFKRLAGVYNFSIVDGRGSVSDVFGKLCQQMESVLADITAEQRQ